MYSRAFYIARKHDLLGTCFTSLTKLYTLPNVELSEAFIKLREQAHRHYQKPSDLEADSELEVINNTSLMFFSISQKPNFKPSRACSVRGPDVTNMQNSHLGRLYSLAWLKQNHGRNGAISTVACTRRRRTTF